MMHFQVLTPPGVLIKTDIQKISFEATDGFHTLLPRHIDFVAALKTGIVTYKTGAGENGYLACGAGILIKKGDSVRLATRLGILGTNPNDLAKVIETDFKKMEETRKENSKALAQMEISLAQGLLQLNRGGKHGAL